MPKVGDRVLVEGTKVGGGRREGTLTKVVGRMIQVRWSDGTETLFSPGAGTVQYVAGNGKTAKPKAAAPAAARAKPAPAKAKGGKKTGKK